MDAEPKERKIHDCAELPKFANLALDPDCLERIVKSFVAPIWRGSGQYGFALELSGSKEERLIVKVSEINEQELRIACELNALKEETPVFPHTHGWLICHKIPHRWLLQLNSHIRNHRFSLAPPPDKFMFTFIQPVYAKWSDVSLIPDHGYRVALFFLLHGLYVAKTRFGFTHGDIHSGNVMIETNTSRLRSNGLEPFRLRFGGGQYEVDLSIESVPRLIDYGRSSTTTNRFYEAEGNDLTQLRHLFDETLDKDTEIPEMIEERADVILTMLTHDYFKVPEIQLQKVKEQAMEPIQRCFSCCVSNPQFQVDHKMSPVKYFCGNYCYDRFGAIGRFIK